MDRWRHFAQSIKNLKFEINNNGRAAAKSDDDDRHDWWNHAKDEGATASLALRRKVLLN